MSAEDQSDNESIAKLAYLLWESRGRPAGTSAQDWAEAEAQFMAGKAAKATKAVKAAAASSSTVASIPTLDTPAKAKTEREKDKGDRRKPRSRKAMTRESDGPSSP